jgi:hypothetical protein
LKNKTQNNIQNKSQNNIQNKSQNIKNNKNIKNNLEQAKTSIMSLEKLKIEYSLQLNAYQQAIANYVNYLQQNANTDSSTPSLVTIPGKVFWGSGQTGNPSVSVGGTVEQCQALCSSTTNCSGATYNPTAYAQPMCWLRTGEGQVVPALETDVAIIPEAQKYLLIIESINTKLISTNQQIQNIINKTLPVYNSMKTEGQAFTKDLALLVDIMRGTIYRDFDVEHPSQKLADKIVDVKMSRFGPQAVIDYNRVMPEIKHKPHKPFNKDIKDEIKFQNDGWTDFEADFDLPEDTDER